MSTILIKNGLLVNRGVSKHMDILIKNDRIQKVDSSIDFQADKTIDAKGKLVIPGIIDDQVHFREPGITYKAEIGTESKAAAAGGVTSFMEMPNVKPATLTQELLQDKYDRAAARSWVNYSFFMGASNDNYEEVMKTNPENVCGIKIFMGSSTGNMLVDNEITLQKLFANCNMLIATHCEDETTIRKNLAQFKEKYGDKLTAKHHPLIRNEEGCLISSSLAVDLATKNGTRLHILHISTEDELVLFRNDIPLKQKKITAEACVHHMYFTADDYDRLGNFIKCNPAIKSSNHAPKILDAVIDNTIDIIATDHAPHTLEEKQNSYLTAPSGLPLVQHPLNLMMSLSQQGKITIEKVIEKMCHAPADCFNVVDRGYLDEGYFADIVIVDPESIWTVEKQNLHYKCGWSPLEGNEFKGKVETTIVNGNIVYDKEIFYHQGNGQRLTFDKN